MGKLPPTIQIWWYEVKFCIRDIPCEMMTISGSAECDMTVGNLQRRK